MITATHWHDTYFFLGMRFWFKFVVLKCVSWLFSWASWLLLPSGEWYRTLLMTNKCWLRSIKPHGITRPARLNDLISYLRFVETAETFIKLNGWLLCMWGRPRMRLLILMLAYNFTVWWHIALPITIACICKHCTLTLPWGITFWMMLSGHENLAKSLKAREKHP